MCRSRSESKIGSYAGRMAPPGMPKTTSTSSSSRERTKDCAPVSCSAVTSGLSGSDGNGVFEQTKTPRAEHGGASARSTETSGHAPRDYYDKSLHPLTVANCSKHCQAEGRNGRLAIRDRRSQPHTAPVAAEPTSLAYLASTPVG